MVLTPERRKVLSKWVFWPLRIAVGVILIIVGVIGLVAPVLPGWLLIFAGILIAAPDSKIAHWLRAQGHRLREKVARHRHPADCPDDQQNPDAK